MVSGKGSAWHVALRRAAHQVLDTPVVFHDSFAIPLLGPEGAEAIQRTPRTSKRGWSRSLRAFAAARSRFAEDQLAKAVRAGTDQYCLLGAGFDTFALRNPWPCLRVFEVDRPSMLQRKQAAMRQAALEPPLCLMPVAADLSDLSDLASALEALDHSKACFFAMLGVAPYLAEATLVAVLAQVRTFGPGSGIVFDYRLPRSLLNEEEQLQHDSLAGRLAIAEEPFRSFAAPDKMVALLSSFRHVEQLAPADLNALYFKDRSDQLCILGDAVRMAVAWV